MTSNQLQLQANVEINRHNLVAEEIAGKQLDLDNRIADETERHNKAMEKRQESYDKAYLAYQTASTEKKLALEKRMQELNESIANEGSWYQQRQSEFQQEKNMIDAMRASEDERHNKAVEKLTTTQNTLKYNEVSLRAQELMNEVYMNQFRVNMGFNQFKLDMMNSKHKFDMDDLSFKADALKWFGDKILNLGEASKKFWSLGIDAISGNTN